MFGGLTEKLRRDRKGARLLLDTKDGAVFNEFMDAIVPRFVFFVLALGLGSSSIKGEEITFETLGTAIGYSLYIAAWLLLLMWSIQGYKKFRAYQKVKKELKKEGKI